MNNYPFIKGDITTETPAVPSSVAPLTGSPLRSDRLLRRTGAKAMAGDSVVSNLKFYNHSQR
jgi:hypothetical protein